MDAATHLRKADYFVAIAPLDRARVLIKEYHYSKSAPAVATFVHGLFAQADPNTCIGVALWMPPTSRRAAEAFWPEGDWRRILSLSRLVIIPGIPTNAASFLIGQSVRLIRQDGRYLCLATYADEWQGSVSEMERLGYTIAAHSRKHKFRLLLPEKPRKLLSAKEIVWRQTSGTGAQSTKTASF